MLKFGFQHATTFVDSLARLRYVTGLIRGTSKDASDVDPSNEGWGRLPILKSLMTSQNQSTSTDPPTYSRYDLPSGVVKEVQAACAKRNLGFIIDPVIPPSKPLPSCSDGTFAHSIEHPPASVRIRTAIGKAWWAEWFWPDKLITTDFATTVSVPSEDAIESTGWKAASSGLRRQYDLDYTARTNYRSPLDQSQSTAVSKASTEVSQQVANFDKDTASGVLRDSQWYSAGWASDDHPKASKLSESQARLLLSGVTTALSDRSRLTGEVPWTDASTSKGSVESKAGPSRIVAATNWADIRRDAETAMSLIEQLDSGGEWAKSGQMQQTKKWLRAMMTNQASLAPG